MGVGKGDKIAILAANSVEYLETFIGGLRAGMGYLGTQNITELRTKTRFIQISAATVRENHPHDIAITQESPNYTTEHLTDTL